MPSSQFVLHVCSECPCCEEGSVEDKFYCRHPDRDFLDAEVDVFGPPPTYCPIRVTPMLLVVRGSEP